jgi:hypothetical protein
MKELQQQIITGMKRWERVEDASLVSTSTIIGKTENPFVRLVMEIIQRDTQMHHNIQEWIAQSMADNAAILTYDDLSQVWELIRHHIDLERQMVDMVKEMIAAVQGKHMVMQEYLLNFLLTDENKHGDLLKRLEQIKQGLLP